MRMLNDWLTYCNECLRIIEETFIRQNVFNIFKQFRRPRLIETDPTFTTHTYELHNDWRRTHTYSQVHARWRRGVVRLCMRGTLSYSNRPCIKWPPLGYCHFIFQTSINLIRHSHHFFIFVSACIRCYPCRSVWCTQLNIYLDSFRWLRVAVLYWLGI